MVLQQPPEETILKYHSQIRAAPLAAPLKFDGISTYWNLHQWHRNNIIWDWNINGINFQRCVWRASCSGREEGPCLLCGFPRSLGQPTWQGECQGDEPRDQGMTHSKQKEIAAETYRSMGGLKHIVKICKEIVTGSYKNICFLILSSCCGGRCDYGLPPCAGTIYWRASQEGNNWSILVGFCQSNQNTFLRQRWQTWLAMKINEVGEVSQSMWWSNQKDKKSSEQDELVQGKKSEEKNQLHNSKSTKKQTPPFVHFLSSLCANVTLSQFCSCSQVLSIPKSARASDVDFTELLCGPKMAADPGTNHGNQFWTDLIIWVSINLYCLIMSMLTAVFAAYWTSTETDCILRCEVCDESEDEDSEL